MNTTFTTPEIPAADFNEITGTVRESYGLQVRAIRTGAGVQFKVTGSQDSVHAFAKSY